MSSIQFGPLTTAGPQPRYECLPTAHEFTPPLLVEKRVGVYRGVAMATSICAKCGKTKVWAV